MEWKRNVRYLNVGHNIKQLACKYKVGCLKQFNTFFVEANDDLVTLKRHWKVCFYEFLFLQHTGMLKTNSVLVLALDRIVLDGKLILNISN